MCVRNPPGNPRRASGLGSLLTHSHITHIKECVAREGIGEPEPTRRDSMARPAPSRLKSVSGAEQVLSKARLTTLPGP